MGDRRRKHAIRQASSDRLLVGALAVGKPDQLQRVGRGGVVFTDCDDASSGAGMMPRGLPGSSYRLKTWARLRQSLQQIRLCQIVSAQKTRDSPPGFPHQGDSSRGSRDPGR